MKSMWHCIFYNGLWSIVINSKYIKGVSFFNWFRSSEIDQKDALVIWKSFIKNFHWIRKWTSWDIGNDKNVCIGIDPFLGDNGNYEFSVEILEHLEGTGLKNLSQIKIPIWDVFKGGYWFNSRDIGIFCSLLYGTITSFL